MKLFSLCALVTLCSLHTVYSNGFAALTGVGKQGVGVKDPQTELDVKGTIQVDASRDGLNGLRILEDTLGDSNARFELGNGGQNGGFRFYSNLRPTAGGNWGEGDSKHLMSILGDGKVGIGTATPVEALEVLGTVKATKFVGDGSELTGINIPASIWSQNGSNIYINTGLIGLGTSSPSVKLDVVGDVKATKFIGDGSQLTNLNVPTALWSQNGSDISFNNGKVGIGTESPMGSLEISSSNDQGISRLLVLKNDNDVSGVGSLLEFHSKIGTQVKLTAINPSAGSDNSTFQIQTRSQSGFNDGLFIDNDGRVGLGNTAPNQELDVSGDIQSENLYLDNGFGISKIHANDSIKINFASDSEDENQSFQIGREYYVSSDVIAQHIFLKVDQNGRVGVGVQSPSEQLDVLGNVKANSFIGDGSQLTGIDASQWDDVTGGISYLSGKVGIGMDPSASELSVNTLNEEIAAFYRSNVKMIEFQAAGNGAGGLMALYNNSNTKTIELDGRSGTVNATTYIGDGSQLTGINASLWSSVTDGIKFNSGRVAIGTDTVDAEATLLVEGLLRAKKIVVKQAGADFVFEDDYELLPLKEVEMHIKAKKHLPHVAPAREMEADGVEVSEMQQTLLRKIEELTLYTIQQQKIIEDQQQSIQELKQSVSKLAAPAK